MKQLFYMVFFITFFQLKLLSQDSTKVKSPSRAFDISESLRKKLNIDKIKEEKVESVMNGSADQFKMVRNNKKITPYLRTVLFKQIYAEQDHKLKELLTETQLRIFKEVVFRTGENLRNQNRMKAR